MNQPLFNEAETNPLRVESPDSETAVAGPAGIGTTLKSLREAKRLSKNEVCSRLKYSARQLEALEGEQWSLLPAGVSLRGFVKNYGRLLEADVDALVIMLDSQVGSTGAKPVVVSRATALAPSAIPVHVEPPSRSWGWLIVILILLFVAGFYAIERGWVPDSWLVFDWLRSLKK
jgi:cytoskeleton protein RodZ